MSKDVEPTLGFPCFSQIFECPAFWIGNEPGQSPGIARKNEFQPVNVDGDDFFIHGSLALGDVGAGPIEKFGEHALERLARFVSKL